MLKDKMQEALNEQINKEIYSSYLYLAMSAAFEDKSLPGLAHWMRVQAQEEWQHALKIYKYIVERGGSVKLKAIDGPPSDFDSPLSMFEQAYEHEKKVTGMINNLMDQAVSDKDYATQSFLKWFVDEQVEEEDAARGIVDKLQMVGDSSNGLFMMDRALAARGSE